MEITLRLQSGDGTARDVVVTGEAGATIEDLARALLQDHRETPGDRPAARESPAGRWTLAGGPPGAATDLVLDPGAPVGESGLGSGWDVTPVREFESPAPRLVPILAIAEVRTGKIAGARFSLTAGEHAVGSDPATRITLPEQGVSARQVLLHCRDSGVTAHLADPGRGSSGEVTPSGLPAAPGSIDLWVGASHVRVTPVRSAPPPPSSLPLGHVPHTRSPWPVPSLSVSERPLPAPPVPSPPQRLPLAALVAPALVGLVLFALTQSTLSLAMVALSPLMLLGSWLDVRLSGRRRERRGVREFRAEVTRERETLTRMRAAEIALRHRAAPGIAEVAEAIRLRTGLLWSRHLSGEDALDVRLGVGSCESATQVALPERGSSSPDVWSDLEHLVNDFRVIGPVPVTERLAVCGSLGVAGPAAVTPGIARALLLQLVGLHSPVDLRLAAVLGDARVASEWDWLGWLPHVGRRSGVLETWPLVGPGAELRGLLGDLERYRDAAGGTGTERARPRVVVLVSDGPDLEPVRARLIALAEDGPAAGVHVIWVAHTLARLPAACHTVLDVRAEHRGAESAVVHEVRLGRATPLDAVDTVTSAQARALARQLAAVRDAAAAARDGTELPQRVRLGDLVRPEPLADPAALAAAWSRTGGAGRGTGTEVSLAAVVGQGLDGPVEIDLRTQGPHALVGGATGSGKSELLQCWIMSLARRLPPDRLTFLLVDYKGGAAFAECTDIPHTLGLVTDLDPALGRRVLQSLRADLRYREELLAAHQVKDLATLERRSASAPPSLVIVVDEFATLVREIPEFIDGMIDIAQRGRSLGLHLILATQRPAGAITENLRANTHVRIALRMADDHDSADVVGVPDAARVSASTPGRAILRAGPRHLTSFQAGYLGAPAHPGADAPIVRVASLGFHATPEGEDARAGRARAAIALQRSTGARDIERVRDALIAAAAHAGTAAPRPVWLPPLPALLSLDEVRAAAPAEAEGGATGVAYGLVDQPERQSQTPVRLDLERDGHVGVFGASGSGKTTVLLTLAATLSERSATDPIHLYGIDAAGGSLDVLRELPTVGQVASTHDPELVRRVLRHLAGVVAERGQRFAEVRAENLPAYRSAAHATEPRVVLLLDGFDGTHWVEELLPLVRCGRAVGVHVILTADRPGCVPSTLGSYLTRRLALRLSSPIDAAALDVDADLLSHAPPGRGVSAGTTDELQVALLDATPSLAAQAAALRRLAERLSRQRLVPVVPVRHPPVEVLLDRLPVGDAERPTYGICADTLDPISFPSRGLAVVAGPAGSGLSSAALTCAVATLRAQDGPPQPEGSLLLTCSDQQGELDSWPGWGRVVRGVLDVAAAASACAAALAAGGGPRVVVVERAIDAEGTPAGDALIALARAARRSGALVVFEFESGTSRGLGLRQALAQPTWGLAMRPDGSDGALPFRERLDLVANQSFPAGRGIAIEAGRSRPVQVATARPAGSRRAPEPFRVGYSA